MTTSSLDFFRQHDAFTEPGRHRELIRSFPEDLGETCRWIQGLLIHPLEAKDVYGVEIPHDTAWREENIHSIERLLDLVLAKDPRPVSFPRDAEKRVAVICRTYSTLLTSILRERGIPARARAGCASYFDLGKAEDHWICEWFSESELRWVRTDAQLDPAHLAAFNISFDPLDLPAGAFLVAGEAWEQVREGELDPASCGIEKYWGRDWLRAQLFRDVEALAGVELQPWEEWGIGDEMDPSMDRFVHVLDEMAEVSVSGSHDAAIALIARHPRLFRGRSFVGIPDEENPALPRG